MSSIIKRRDTQPQGAEDAPAPAAPGPRARPPRAHEKRLEVLRLEGRIHALELTCSCGEVSLIELDYPGNDPAGAA